MTALDDRVEEVKQYATEHGWQCYSMPVDVQGVNDAVGVGGVFRLVNEPGIAHGEEFMFTIAFGINPDTGRVNTLLQGEYANARFVITIEDGTGRYWHGPWRSWKRALADPLDWTGYVSDAQAVGTKG